MTLTTLFWLASAMTAVLLGSWTWYVWRVLSTAPMYAPVRDLVLLHPLSFGLVCFGPSAQREQPSCYRVWWRPSGNRFLAFMLVALTPGLNLLALLTPLLVILWLLSSIGWTLWSTRNDPV